MTSQKEEAIKHAVTELLSKIGDQVERELMPPITIVEKHNIVNNRSSITAFCKLSVTIDLSRSHT